MFHVKHLGKKMNQREFIKLLLKESEDFGISLVEKEANLLFLYYSELFLWNKRINLISQKEKDRFIKRHIIDSLSILLNLRIEKSDKLLDIGSGNGLPAIPLAVKFPESKVDMIESNGKKCIFLRHIRSKLKLKNTSVLCERFEHEYESLKDYDYVLVRGKRILEKEKEMIMHCLKKHGSLIIYAGVKPNTSVLKFREKVEYFKGIEGRKIIKINHV